MAMTADAPAAVNLPAGRRGAAFLTVALVIARAVNVLQ